MRKWTATFIFCASVYLLPLKAMEVDEHENALCSPLIIEIILNNVFIDVQTALTLSEVNQALYTIAGDSFWQSLYRQIHGDDKKQNDSLTFKQNYLLFNSVKATFATVNECRMKLSNIYQKHKWIKFGEVICKDNGELSSLETASQQKEKIYCTCLTMGMPSFMQNNPRTREAFDLALTQDVLVVLTTGRHSKSYPSIISDGDLHEIYPNVIWTTQCDEHGTICLYANFGKLVDIAIMPPEDGNTSLALAEFLAYLRWLRPDLSAVEIRLLVIEFSDQTEESKEKIPVGRILNCQSVIKAVLEHDRGLSGKREPSLDQ